MFDINITAAIQLGNFIVTLVALNFLLIRPMRDIIKKRRDLASGMLDDAEKFTADAAEKLETYEAALAKAREEAAAVRDSRKSEGAAREAELLESASRDAQEFLQSSREGIRAAVAEAAAAMEKRIPDLGKMVAARLRDTSGRPSAG